MPRHPATQRGARSTSSEAGDAAPLRVGGRPPVRADDPVPLKVGLEAFFHHLGAPPVDRFRQLGERWPEVVGPALAGPTRPAELRDGVLVVLCDDPAWASQIQWMETQIIERYRAVLPDVAIERIRIRVIR